VQLWQALVENPGTKTQRVLTESAVKVEAFKQKLIALTEADLQRSSYRF
jgi:hypothetical protein